MNKPVFIFDMAGVLLDFYFDRIKVNVAKELNLPYDYIAGIWLNAEYTRAELGKIKGEDYFIHFSKKIGLQWSYKDWINAWSEVCERNENGLTLISMLKQKDYEVNILSNLAEFHKLAAEKKFPEFWKTAHRNFLSYELGMLKPNPDIFIKVCKSLGKEPAECYFFDDTLENIHSANELGLKAFHFTKEKLPAIITELEMDGINLRSEMDFKLSDK